MAKAEAEKMELQAGTWMYEDRIERLHRCRLLLHGEGVLADYENANVDKRISALTDRKNGDNEEMESLVGSS